MDVTVAVIRNKRSTYLRKYTYLKHTSYTANFLLMIAEMWCTA